MKTKQFETHQGKFGIIDLPKESHSLKWGSQGIEVKILSKDKAFKNVFEGNIETMIILSVATEEQAEMVVGKNHLTNESCKRQLHSLIRGLGIHLYENPFGVKKNYYVDCYTDMFTIAKIARKEEQWLNAESQTFYNPFIFKIV